MVALASPFQVKAIPERKRDESDAEWLAKRLRRGSGTSLSGSGQTSRTALTRSLRETGS